MSTLPESEFDLEKLFLPAWAQQEPSSNKYAKYEGEAERPERRGDRKGPRPPRREWGPKREGIANREGGPRGRDDRERRPAPGDRPRPARGERSERPAFRRDEPREHREPLAPLPEINITLLPDERGVESLARQIKMTGRAYPLFDIAQMILQKPERHAVAFGIKKNAEGKPIQPLSVCALDDTLWLSEDEAVAHVLRRHFNTFYQAERTATEPPKGKYTFVAQCGMSGVILGPPNYHDYQNQLRKLHAERFSRMPFEVYKSRVKIVRDEEVVKKWVEDQSWKTEYLCLNMPEPLRLPNMEAVEKHFRENHKENIIKPVEAHTLTGVAARGLRCQPLTRALRSVWEDQRRFPLQIATVLSQQFASHGLQFFKVNKTITHVSVARPHYLDMAATPVSEVVKSIVDYINSHPRCNRRQLIEALAPTPPPAPIPVAPAVQEPSVPAPAPAPAEPAPEATTVPAESAQPTPPPASQAAPRADTASPTPEQTAIVSDLHWLIHQGHVIEFANGTLESAKKPVPKPPKPEPKPAEKSEGTPTAPGEAAPVLTAPAETPQTSELPTQPADVPSAASPATEIPVEPSSDVSSTEPVPSAPESKPPVEPAGEHAAETPVESQSS